MSGERRPEDGRREHPGTARPADPESSDAAEEVAVRILAGAAQSASALQRRLERRGFTAEAASAATAAMVARGYVDDDALARSIASRRQRSGHGRIAVIAELRARGVEDTAIDDVVATVDGEAERGAALELARRLAQRPRSDPSTRDGQQRLAAAMQRRGFDHDTIRSALRQLESGAAR